MNEITLKEIVLATGGKVINQGDQTATSFVTTDTRTLKQGDLFFALKGEHFDGHDFLTQAYSRGCKMVVVSDEKNQIKPFVTAILVKDTTTALGDLAAFYRKKIKIPVTAVTGSNGKTTTKEILGSLLRSTCEVAMTQGTKNNLIGVPQTIFSADSSHDVLVLELGINRFGEMGRLGEISKPDIVVITNISPSHLEFLENEEGVFRAKTELFDHIDATKSVILNRDNRFFETIKKKSPCPVITFALENDADYRAKNVAVSRSKITFDLYVFGEHRGRISLPLKGEHNVMNFLAALAAAEKAGVSWENAKESLKNLVLPGMRLETLIIDSITIINDAYNANPVSTIAAIKELQNTEAEGKKIMVFADMLELGEKSEEYHREIGRFINNSRLDVLIMVGKMAQYCGEEITSNTQISKLAVKCVEQVYPVLREILSAGDVVLLKGSRANHLEKVIDAIKSEDVRVV